MLEFVIVRGLKGLAKLSGSFAVSGLLGSSVAYGSVQAFALTDPVEYHFKYPIKRRSGKVVSDLRGGSGIVRHLHWIHDICSHPTTCSSSSLGPESMKQDLTWNARSM